MQNIIVGLQKIFVPALSERDVEVQGRSTSVNTFQALPPSIIAPTLLGACEFCFNGVSLDICLDQ